MLLNLFFLQVKYYTDCHKVYSDLSKKFEKKDSELSAPDQDYNKRMNQRLNDIKALSIVDENSVWYMDNDIDIANTIIYAFL